MDSKFHVGSKISWWLMIHEFPVSTVDKWNSMFKSCYRRWLGVALSTEAGIFYRMNEHFGLNVKCLTSVHRQLQAIKWHILKYSNYGIARDLYQRRLKLDRKGHKGTGRVD